MYEVKLEKFEGPLDLLLQLIEANDLDINQISLAKIADEYINYVNSREDEISLESLADFLLVASKLLYIKSKSLLPYLALDDEEDTVGLDDQLKLYKEFLDASRKLVDIIKQRNFLFSRERIVVPKGFYPPPKITLRNLREAYLEILQKIEPLIRTGREMKERMVSVRQRIEDLRAKIEQKARLGFRELISRAKNKTEVIVSFLALLELVKQKIINVEQGNLFEDIIITNTKSLDRSK